MSYRRNESAGPDPGPQRSWRLALVSTAVLAVILVPYFLFGGAIDRWTADFVARSAAHPWRVAAVLGGLLAGDIILPVPSSLVSTACGHLLGFARGTLVSFAGMTVSAAGGYLLGRRAAGFAERRLPARDRARLVRLHGRWGVWMLAAVRPVPVLAEASILFAGLARLPWRRALPLVLAANLGVSAVYGAIGAWTRGEDAFLLAFLAAAGLSGLAMLPLRSRHSLRD